MFKEIIQSLLGVILALGGIFLFYLFITTLNNGANFLYFGLAIFLIAAAIFLFIRAEKSDTLILNRTVDETKTDAFSFVSTQESLPNKLEQNNATLADWNKTNATRDKMKMIEISSTPVKPEG